MDGGGRGGLGEGLYEVLHKENEPKPTPNQAKSESQIEPNHGNPLKSMQIILLTG